MPRMLSVVLLFTYCACALGGDVDEGVAAYRRGDYTAAFPKFMKAAKQGIARAQYNLGLIYNKGQGVTKDARQAVYWYTKAAKQGYAHAQVNLG